MKNILKQILFYLLYIHYEKTKNILVYIMVINGTVPKESQNVYLVGHKIRHL